MDSLFPVNIGNADIRVSIQLALGNQDEYGRGIVLVLAAVGIVCSNAINSHLQFVAKYCRDAY